MSYLLLGIFLALCGASSLALAMVTQRYALAYHSESVPFCGTNLPRNVVWFIGLIIYGVANGFYAMSLMFGPLSLLAGVFTTLLVFNMLFARYFLGEELSPPRVIGAVLILCGVVLCVAGTPSGVETDFSPRDINHLSARPAGAVYVSALMLAVLASVAVISWYEAKFPAHNTISGHSIRKSDSGLEIAGGSKGEEGRSQYDELTVASSSDAPLAPPRWLDSVMGVVYPGSLGLDEGIAHLTMKASISMLDNCSGENECGMPILYIFIAVWVTASIATLWWLRRVFGRYESTLALPVEYGSVNAVSVCSGLIYYRESQYMSDWQLSLLVIGVVVILCGISAGRIKPSLPYENGQSNALQS